MTEYAIKTTLTIPGRGTMYVARGINPATGTARYTDRFPLVMTFKTHKAANKFRRRHETSGWEIVTAPSVIS